MANITMTETAIHRLTLLKKNAKHLRLYLDSVFEVVGALG